MNTSFPASCFLLLLTHAASEADFQVMTPCHPYTEFTSSAVVVKFLGCPLGLTSHLELLASEFKDTYNSLNKGLSSDTNTCDPVFREVTSVIAFLPADFEVDFDRRLSNSEYDDDDDVDRDGVDGDNDGDDDDGVDGDNDGDSNDNGGANDGAESDDECPDKFEVRFDITARCRGCDLNTVTIFDEDNDANHYDGDRHLVLRKLQLRHDERQLQNDCICPINPEYRAVTEEEMVDAYDSALDQLYYLPPLSVKDVIEIKQVECDPIKSNFGTTIDLTFDTDSPAKTVSTEILTTLSVNFLQSYNDFSDRFCDPNFRFVQTVEVVTYTVTLATRRELQTYTTNYVLNLSFFFVGSCRGCPSDSGLFVSK